MQAVLKGGEKIQMNGGDRASTQGIATMLGVTLRA